MRYTGCVLLLVSEALAGAGTPQSTGFTDVTAASGVEAVVAAHYRNVPRWWLSGMTLVDLDGDGHLDLHLAGHGSPAAVAFNDGRGTFTYVDPKLALARGVRHDNDVPYPGGEIRLPYDFDEDGRLDLLCSWHDGGGVMYLNACARDATGPTANFHRSRLLDVFCRGCGVFDVDRDGQADFLSDDGREIAVRFGAGGGVFGKRTGRIPGGFDQSGFIPADVNGDGHIDLLMHGRTGGNFYHASPFERRILLNDGKGGFVDATEKAGLDPRGGSIHGAGDVNGDGHPDLICVEGRDIAVHLGDGAGRFARLAGAATGLEKVRNKPNRPEWGGAVVVDLDNDALADVLIVGRYFLYVLRGTGGGRLAYANDDWHLPNTAWSAVDEGLCFGDVNGDGRLDLVTCARGPDGREKGVQLWRNDLPKRHWLRVRLLGAKGNRAAAGAKVHVYKAGTRELLAYEQVCLWGRQSFHGYYAASRTERHFGLGECGKVDVGVEFCPSGRRVELRGVDADRSVEVREEGQ